MIASKYARWRMPHTDKCKSYDQSWQTAVTVHLCTRYQISPNTSEAEVATAATGAGVGPTGAEDPSRAAGPNPGRTTDSVHHTCVNTVGETHTTPNKNAES